MRGRIGAAGLRAAPALWSAVLAVLVLGGALGPGYVLSYDMVWVPDLAVRGDFWGTGSSLPRAVPSDLVVALLDEVVPGMLLQKVALLGALVVAGAGAARLVPGTGLVGPLAAATLYVWNPFVAERLGIGHWPLLLTYASLPWIFLCARRLAAGERALPQLVLWVVLASLSPVGGIVAGVMVVAAVAASARGVRRPLLVATGAVLAVNAPWIVAGAVHGSATVSDPAAVALFAAQGEGVMPPWLAVLGLGGIWNAEVVPASRTTVVGLAALVLVLAVCVAGLTTWRRRTPRAERHALVAVAVVGLVVALAGRVAPDAVAWLVGHVPGAGLLRDGTRFVALVAPLQALLFGLGAARLAAAVPVRAVGLGVGTFLVLVPVMTMPDAARGVSGRLEAVDFPEEYATVRQAVERDRQAGHPGDVLLLPFTSYRQPGWNDGRRTLDPLGRYLPADYLASDTLVVSGEEIAGEDQRAARVGHHLATLEGPALEQALAGEGIGWVVLDREAAAALAAQEVDAPGYGGSVELGSAEVLHRGTLLTAWQLATPTGHVTPGPADTAPARALLALAWGLAALTLLTALYRSVGTRVTSRRQLRRSD
ncbi:hypothetical protein [Nocardioides flavus (ex Wang et al. 2016)]|uniref:hypothetical protein n=1 Tax=Nocardioides flavus (ex Wang et al. 2016) TaxID=2058780 RepID=UPI00174C59B3|nr:hypothetical protein [Nocardioides flavus (ex Wang et al. 2016)]